MFLRNNRAWGQGAHSEEGEGEERRRRREGANNDASSGGHAGYSATGGLHGCEREQGGAVRAWYKRILGLVVCAVWPGQQRELSLTNASGAVVSLFEYLA